MCISGMQHSKCFTKCWEQSQVASSPTVQKCDFSCDTDVHAPAQSAALLPGTCCNEAQCEAEISTALLMSTLVNPHIHRISSISPDLTGAVCLSLRGGVLSRQQPVGGVVRVLLVCMTLRAAAERGTEACADWLCEQHKHDAVGCSLRGVANSLLGPNKGL